MEPQERGRGEGKAEGRGERRIMAELLTTPWTAEEDFLHQCAGVGADRCRYLPTHSVQPPGMACMTGGEGGQDTVYVVRNWPVHPFSL